ncbi:unnamed protein product [marine sediment metagenome]|uniref:Uncharacterized protein n=2 Tax=marine sediment metagenome TaxID=412755 RepID=X1RCH2_9ZZZZ
MRVAGLSSLGKRDINLYGQKYTMAALDADEQTVLEDNFNKLLGTTDSQVRRIFEERVDTIVAGIMAIKEKLENRKFRGMNPGDAEIGMAFIRPGFTIYDSGIRTDWNVALAGMGTFSRFLDESATAGFLLSEDFGLIITHLVSQVTPEPYVRAVHFKIGRIDLIPEEVSDILLGDNENGVAVFPVPTKFVLPEDELTVTVEGHAGTEYLKLGGLVIGMGRLLKREDLTDPEWG